MQVLEAASSAGPGSPSPYGEESGEEELSVLPRHTKVVVTGNNRTKSVLVGLRGVVKKAVGLGGWHWLVLTNGEEVKLQRNALSVIEPPTGQEGDQENECENMVSSGSELASDDLQKPKNKVQHHKSVLSVTKGTSKNHYGDLQSTESRPSKLMLMVKLSKLQTETLRRYSRHFNLADLSANLSREQLLKAVEKHFVSQQLDEWQVIAGFIQAARRLRRPSN